MEIQLKLNSLEARIDEGELVGLLLAGKERIHQKGDPGWRNADTEMFPIIGPTAAADFSVTTPRGLAIQDQHGLLREMNYQCVEKTSTTATFVKTYAANKEIENSKFPDKSSEPLLSWPYSFEFVKRFKLLADGLQVSFEIQGEEQMPFMLGYHPAFKLVSTLPRLEANNLEISLADVMAVGSRAFHVPACNEVTLVDEDHLRITSKGFGAFMLWTEVPNMICIEPISFYPYDVQQNELHSGFTILNESPVRCEVTIRMAS